MSRRARAELQFGSDSFLDVVCNLVGILIILIVIAGVRVSKAPLVLKIAAPQAAQNPSALAPRRDEAPLEAAAAEAFPLPAPQPVLAPPPEPVAPPEPPPELVEQSQALTRELTALDAQMQSAAARLAQFHEAQSALDDRLQTARSLLDTRQSELQEAQEVAASTVIELESLKKTVETLTEQLRETENRGVPQQQIKHQITPVGKTVTGKERHFRLLNNRVAVVPLEMLVERVKDQVERRKDILAKQPQHHGQVGPIGGFSLHYIVQRESLSVVDELRYGQGMFRISVAQWQIEAERDLVTESPEQALKRGSRFYQTLLEADPDTALTFWVYPDSFDAYTRLKEFCHEQNFLVAGRPLPLGVPIAGSPNGTRSAGQ